MFITRGVLKGDGYRIGGGISPIYRSHRGNVESIESDSASYVTHTSPDHSVGLVGEGGAPRKFGIIANKSASSSALKSCLIILGGEEWCS